MTIDKERKGDGRQGFNTRAVHAGSHPCPATGSIVPPIYQTSTFVFENADQGAARFAHTEDGYIYSRLGNPTITSLQENIASLEGGDEGYAFGSGLAAIHAAVMSVARSGDEVLATDAIYGGTHVQFTRTLPRYGVVVRFVDTSDISAVEAAITERTRVLFLETPANPSLKLADIEALSSLAHKHGIHVIVDNTFMSPTYQRPLELGADTVVHSLTKYLNGHSDVVGGMVVTTKDHGPNVYQILVDVGGMLDPFAAWLVVRGIKTLPLRMERSTSNAQRIAEFLEGHPSIEKVHYPGLATHPQHELALRQMSGTGSIISFELAGGLDAGKTLMDSVKVCALAVSLGAVETLIQHPPSMTHAGIPREQRIASGIPDGLVRLSVGIEDVEDIIADLEQGLAMVK